MTLFRSGLPASLASLALGMTLSLGAAAAEPGYYVGAGLGAWAIDESGFEDTTLAVRGQVGYRYNDYLSWEGTALYGDELEDGILGIDTTGIELAVRPSLPLSDAIEAYARLGWGWYDFEANGVFNGVEGSDDGFVFGVGGAWQANSRWSLFVEYSQPDFDVDTGFLWLGFNYHPGR